MLFMRWVKVFATGSPTHFTAGNLTSGIATGSNNQFNTLTLLHQTTQREETNKVPRNKKTKTEDKDKGKFSITFLAVHNSSIGLIVCPSVTTN